MHSRKKVIVSNGLLVDSKFESKSEEEKRKSWTWARCSDGVKKLEADFLATVHAAKKLALLKKEDLKKKKAGKTLVVLENCKSHGGPMTPNNLDPLSTLTGKQLLTEILYQGSQLLQIFAK